ncbi:MAG TPA: Uma2 family endonuclease [Thermoanaerobaculia bacterium]|nr:Uma2 family endonuclease [Thermoanaerobaculia bacterium]
MAPAASTKLTYEDYCLLPDDGRRHEIIDGEHYVNPTPNTKHQVASVNLTSALWIYVREHRLGRIFSAPYDVVLSNFDVVVPDIIFVSATRMSIITDANIKGAPDLVIEILSPSNRRYDEVVKFNRYDAMGIAEYWIVDPDREMVKIYRRTSGGFALVPPADDLTTPLIPGFSLAVRAIFEQA